jgi:hypothetical protein
MDNPGLLLRKLTDCTTGGIGEGDAEPRTLLPRCVQIEHDRASFRGVELKGGIKDCDGRRPCSGAGPAQKGIADSSSACNPLSSARAEWAPMFFAESLHMNRQV